MKYFVTCSLSLTLVFREVWNVQAFVPVSSSVTSSNYQPNAWSAKKNFFDIEEEADIHHVENNQRREILTGGCGSVAAAAAFSTLACLGIPSVAKADESMYAPKFVQEYPDFTQTSEGWSYKDVKVGTGESPKIGDRVVYEWSGYTIGYFGRPFEAKG